MSAVLPLVALGVLAFGMSKRSSSRPAPIIPSPVPKPNSSSPQGSSSSSSSSSNSSYPEGSSNSASDVALEKERITQEAAEIIKGERTEFSSDELTDAMKAAQLASQLERTSTPINIVTPKPAPKPVVKPVVKPVLIKPVLKPPAPKPKPAPIKLPPVVVRPPQPAPAPYVAPQPAPAPYVAPQSTKPAGYDKLKASNSAKDVARHLASKGIRLYSRDVLKAWQKVAGIPQDGIYGRGSYAALKYFTGDQAPKPFFAQGEEFYPWQ